MTSKNCCPQARVIVSDDKELSLLTTKEGDLFEEILNGILVAAIIFVVVWMILSEIGNNPNYRSGAARPGRPLGLHEYYAIEGARATSDHHHDRGLPRDEETLWK
ncbi:MAG: hypothetical protein A4E60_02722 [Syntrophorhabdus sp. PtaB.Bin047]|jgi:hypothetical protein|nr:MAG: hypothetical protein A4E60_02722 [Syntrophorhabdus sp. PtaB.Bin047]